MLLGTSAGALRGDCQSQTVSFTRRGDAIQVDIGGQPFTTYHFDPKVAKPFFQPLRTANGITVTRGFPSANTVPSGYDQDPNLEPHQRDMYFAHGNIDGYDFWSEEVFAKYYDTVHAETFGRMVLRTVEEQNSGSSSATIRATFDLEGPDKKPFAQEVQTFTFSGDKDSRAVDCTFVLHAARRALIFGDTKEGTFALRLAPQLTAPAEPWSTPREESGEPQIWGKRADWVNVDGRDRGPFARRRYLR